MIIAATFFENLFLPESDKFDVSFIMFRLLERNFGSIFTLNKITSAKLF